MKNKNKVTLTIFKILIIPYLVYKIIERRKLRREILKDGNPDYKNTASNIIASMKMAKKLHKDLILKVHSDKIQDDSKKEKADELAAKVNLARRDYNRLVALEKEIEEFLQDN